MDLRRFRAILNKAQPKRKGYAGEKRQREIDAARALARGVIEANLEEIAALFGKSAADLAAHVESIGTEAIEAAPDADEAEVWRVILANLLASADARIEAARPERPSLAAVLAAEATFRADPRPETLRALAHVAVESGEAKSIGAPWDRIGKLLDLAPRVGVESRPVLREGLTIAIDVRWTAPTHARYRFAYAPDAIADAAARLVGPAMTSAG